MDRRTLTGGVLIVAQLVGCGPSRVNLPRPPVAPSASAREATYAGMRPRARYLNVTIDGQRQVTQVDSEGLLLERGDLVEHPLDLVPWLPEGSPLIAEAQRFEEADDFARPLGIIEAVGVLVSIPAILASIPTLAEGEAIGWAPAGVGLFALGVSVVMHLLSSDARGELQRTRRAVFLGYDAALKRRLGLCDTPAGLVPCETLASPRPSARVRSTTTPTTGPARSEPSDGVQVDPREL